MKLGPNIQKKRKRVERLVIAIIWTALHRSFGEQSNSKRKETLEKLIELGEIPL